jgi:hypothetical protein
MFAQWSEGHDDPISLVVLWARFGNYGQTIPMSVSNSG